MVGYVFSTEKINIALSEKAPMQCYDSTTFRLFLFSLVSKPEQKKFNGKLQTIQNKCIRFCLQQDSRSQIGIKEFEQLNWLPVSERFLTNAFVFNTFNFF